jgi:hypothetical protein
VLDWLQVLGAAAAAIRAEVVELEPGRDLTDERRVGDAVRVVEATADAKHAVAVRVTGASPLPATHQRELEVELR